MQQQQRQVRVIKRGQAKTAESIVTTSGGSGSEVNLERDVRSVVTGWVREQRRRSEAAWRQHAAVLAEVGFQRG